MSTNKAAKATAKEQQRIRSSSPHAYSQQRFEIPLRTLSLTSQGIQDQLQNLDSAVKRKASELSQSLRSASSKDFLSNKRQQLELEEKKYQILGNGLRESFERGGLKRDEFQEQTASCWKRRAKIIQETVTIDRAERKLQLGLDEYTMDNEPDMELAYAELLPYFWQQYESPAGYERRKQSNHDTWKAAIREHYNSYMPGDPQLLWCPIMKRYGLNRTAAHIVPHAFGYKNVGLMFGEPDNGHDLIWSIRNGITIAGVLEKQFDDGDFVLVPFSADQPNEWKFVLMKEKMRKYPVGDSDIKYGDLDGTKLEWKNDKRPAARFLYFHYVTTMMRYVKFERTGWAEKRMSVPTGKIWASPGRYLKKSVLKKMAHCIGDMEDEKVFEDGTFEGIDTVPEREEELAARDLVAKDVVMHEGDRH